VDVVIYGHRHRFILPMKLQTQTNELVAKYNEQWTFICKNKLFYERAALQ